MDRLSTLKKDKPTVTRRRHHNRRGTVYILVLGTAMIVTTIGMSALLIMRVHTRIAEASLDEVKARFYAQSAVDVATFWIAADADWRPTYTNDTWTPYDTAGELKFRLKFVDEQDGDLADDVYQPVRVYAEAKVKAAVRIYAVVVEPDVDGGWALTGSVTPVPGTWRQEVLP